MIYFNGLMRTFLLSRICNVVGRNILPVLMVVCLGHLTCICSAQAQTSQLFGSTGLDPSFCKQKTFRQTVVYVDDLSIVQGQTAWAVDLEDKLRATLMPGEHVTVVELAPKSGTSQEVWTACYPDYSADEKAQIAKKTYFFTANPGPTP